MKIPSALGTNKPIMHNKSEQNSRAKYFMIFIVKNPICKSSIDNAIEFLDRFEMNINISKITSERYWKIEETCRVILDIEDDDSLVKKITTIVSGDWYIDTNKEMVILQDNDHLDKNNIIWILIERLEDSNF